MQVIVKNQGRVDRKEGGGGVWSWRRGVGQQGGGGGEGGNREVETGMGKWGGVEVLAWVGSGEGEMGREQQEGGDGEVVKRRGRKQGKRRGDFTDGYEEPGWNEVTKFSDFVYPCNAGYPS